MLETEFGLLHDKIIEVCKENKLEFAFECSKFPVIVKITPNLVHRDQMRLDLKELEESSNFVNGEIRLAFGEELTLTILNDFKIEDSLLNRIKNMAKKLHYIYLQIYFKNKTIYEEEI